MNEETLINKIKNIVQEIDEIDNLLKEQPEQQQKIDYMLSDLYHLIQHDEDLTPEQCFNVVNKIKTLRIERESLINIMKIGQVYKANKNKLGGENTGQFLVNEINKATKNLNCDYKNRIYTEDDIAQLLQNKKRGRGRPRKEEQ